jgi:hypothetical protein
LALPSTWPLPIARPALSRSASFNPLPVLGNVLQHPLQVRTTRLPLRFIRPQAQFTDPLAYPWPARLHPQRSPAAIRQPRFRRLLPKDALGSTMEIVGKRGRSRASGRNPSCTVRPPCLPNPTRPIGQRLHTGKTTHPPTTQVSFLRLHEHKRSDTLFLRPPQRGTPPLRPTCPLETSVPSRGPPARTGPPPRHPAPSTPVAPSHRTAPTRAACRSRTERRIRSSPSHSWDILAPGKRATPGPMLLSYPISAVTTKESRGTQSFLLPPREV